LDVMIFLPMDVGLLKAHIPPSSEYYYTIY
jgi:hypothetical protein